MRTEMENSSPNYIWYPDSLLSPDESIQPVTGTIALFVLIPLLAIVAVAGIGLAWFGIFWLGYKVCKRFPILTTDIRELWQPPKASSFPASDHQSMDK